MTTTSLKLPDTLKNRIQHFAAENSVSAHAFMVRTLEAEVERLQHRAAFEAEAEAAAAATDAGEAVYSIDEVERYIKAKLRARTTGEPVTRPRPLNTQVPATRKRSGAARRRA
jgi:predicted transcriptional regulator